jgi:hypothetical protein
MTMTGAARLSYCVLVDSLMRCMSVSLNFTSGERGKEV